MLVQKYIANPFLVEGYKMDIRVYVIATSFDPLRLYMHDDGLIRFATEKYHTPNAKGSGEKVAHHKSKMVKLSWSKMSTGHLFVFIFCFSVLLCNVSICVWMWTAACMVCSNPSSVAHHELFDPEEAVKVRREHRRQRAIMRLKMVRRHPPASPSSPAQPTNIGHPNLWTCCDVHAVRLLTVSAWPLALLCAAAVLLVSLVRSLKAFRAYLREVKGIDDAKVWASIKDTCVRTILCAEAKVYSQIKLHGPLEPCPVQDSFLEPLFLFCI